MADKYYYSAKSNGFYALSQREDYELSAQGWPDDAILLTEKKHRELMGASENNKVIMPDANGKPVIINAPALPKEMAVNMANEAKKNKMSEASEKIRILEDAAELNLASESEAASLVNWKKYRVFLSRIETSAAPEIIWPEVPQ